MQCVVPSVPVCVETRMDGKASWFLACRSAMMGKHRNVVAETGAPITPAHGGEWLSGEYGFVA